MTRESIVHQELVASIKCWITKTQKEETIFYSDSNELASRSDEPPNKIYGYIPDVYAIGKNSNCIYVGEAKSSQADLESEHSQEQLKAFLKYCAQNNAIFIIAVPVYLMNCAASLIRYIKKSNKLEGSQSIVLDLFTL